MKKILLLAAVLLALTCAGLWDGPLGHRHAGHGTWSLTHLAAAVVTPSAEAAIAPVIYYDGGGRPDCTPSIIGMSWSGPYGYQTCSWVRVWWSAYLESEWV